MLETIITNDFFAYLISLGVFLITILMCARHFKKYGVLQGIFSTFCIPMIIHGLGVLCAYIFKSNNDMVLLFKNSVLSLEGIKDVFASLFGGIGIEWFTKGIGLYLPFGIIFVLTYGYSITLSKKKKDKDKKDGKDKKDSKNKKDSKDKKDNKDDEEENEEEEE